MNSVTNSQSHVDWLRCTRSNEGRHQWLYTQKYHTISFPAANHRGLSWMKRRFHFSIALTFTATSHSPTFPNWFTANHNLRRFSTNWVKSPFLLTTTTRMEKLTTCFHRVRSRAKVIYGRQEKKTRLAETLYYGEKLHTSRDSVAIPVLDRMNDHVPLRL